MSSEADLTAAPYPCTVGGKEFSMRRLSDKDYAELDNWYRSTMISMARNAMPEDLSPEERDEVMRAAMAEAHKLSCTDGLSGARKLTRELLIRLTRVFWQGLRAAHPRLTHPEFYELVKANPDDLDNVTDAFFIVNVGDEVKLKEMKEARKEQRDSKKRQAGRSPPAVESATSG